MKYAYGTKLRQEQQLGAKEKKNYEIQEKHTVTEGRPGRKRRLQIEHPQGAEAVLSAFLNVYSLIINARCQQKTENIVPLP
jgi:hypothetical protein